MNILQSYIEKQKLHFQSTMKIGEYVVFKPKDHYLPLLMKKHKLYDRFLPTLAKFLTTENYIIDIGANIGDTAVAMIQNCNNKYIAVEPSDKFYSFLEKNIALLKNKDSNRTTLIKKMIGTGSFSGELTHASGTATISINNNSTQDFVRLDNIIDENFEIEFLKVDIDGFDYDAILSSENILKKNEPIIFWENEIHTNDQNAGYEKMYDLLDSLGYKYLYVFDNFGNILLEECSYSNIKNINRYIKSAEENGGTKTIYYTDILASTEKNISKCRNAINFYKENFINK